MRDDNGFLTLRPQLHYGCAACEFEGTTPAAGDHFVLTGHQLTYKGEPVDFTPCYPGGEVGPEQVAAAKARQQKTFAQKVRENLPLPSFPILPGGKFLPKRGK
jgi:hypothetical protein